MTEDIRNQTRATMYLACATNKGNVRNCEECANRDDCMLKDKSKITVIERIIGIVVGFGIGLLCLRIIGVI